MRIVDGNKKFTPFEAALLTRNPEIYKLSDMDGQEIELCKWCIFEDGEEDDVKEILSICSPDGVVYATNSSTFMREFKSLRELYEQFGYVLTKIKVVSGVSKGGRKFITCAAVDNGEQIAENHD